MAISSSSIFRISFATLAALILLVLSQSGSVHASDTTNYVDGTGTCAGLTPCYDTIQEGVDNVADGGTVNVFQGTYLTGVDLSGLKDVDGGVTLITVNPTGGTPAPGTVTINPPADNTPSGVAFYGCDVAGPITIDGFRVSSPNRDPIEFCGNNDITIKHVEVFNVGPGGGSGVNVSMDSGNIVIMNSVANGFADDGFDLYAGDGDISIIFSQASNNGDNGFVVQSASNVTIRNSRASDNRTAFDVTGSAGVTMSGLNAINNDNEGIYPHSDGPVVVSNSFAEGSGDDGIDIETGGDATIFNSTSTKSGDDGVEIDSGGDVVIDRLSSTNNGQNPEGDGDGVEINSQDSGEFPVDSVSITNSVFIGNDDQAIDIDDPYFEAAGAYAATGNIICQNKDGYASDADISVDGTGNWWGTTSGPTHPSNPTGTGDVIRDSATGDSGTVDFDPWIKTIAGSGGAATQGHPVVVSFEFTGDSLALVQGPGSATSIPTFLATTDNGRLSSSGFVKDGKLEVTLIPKNAGTATVTVTGPCGLDGSTGGNTVVLNVAAAPVAPTPAELPETGSSPAASDGGWSPLVLAVTAGLALVVTGGAVLGLVRRRR